MNRLGLNEISSERKRDRNMDRLKNSLHNRKYTETQKQ